MIKNALLLVLIVLFSCKGNIEVESAFVKKGIFIEELNEQGTLQAVNSITINAPVISYRYGGLKIAKIVDDGVEVKKGDTLIVFDPSEIKKSIIQAEQQLEIAYADLEKMKSTQQSEIQDLESDLELAKISQEIAKINFETSIYEPEATKKELNLKYESATIAVGRAIEQIENKKIIHKEDILQKMLNINQLQSTLSDANASMQRLFVISPTNGIAIKESNWGSQQKWAVGDSPYSGSKLIELPDLDEMRAELKINEVDIAKVLPDQKVEIRPDAYSDSVFYGRVESVANLAQNLDNKSKIKIFPVQVRIDGQSPALLPGLTVSCKILVNEIPQVLYIPLEAIFNEQGNNYVYVKTGTTYKRREVKTGAVNTNYAVITEGLKEDEEVALSNPFINADEFLEKENDKNVAKSGL